MFLSSLTPCNSASFFTQVVQLILSSTTFQNFPRISDLISDVCKFQHHTKLCSKCSILLVSSLNLSPVWWQKVFFLLNATVAVATLNLILWLYIASLIMLPTLLKYSTFSSYFLSITTCTITIKIIVQENVWT